MAFSAVTTRGSTVGITSVNSISHTAFGANITVGKLVVVQVVTTNAQTTDGASTMHSLQDTKSHNWTKIAEYTETSGVANDGTTNSIWFTIVTQELVNNTDSITANFTANSADNIIAAFEATFDNATKIVTFTPGTVGVGQTAIQATVSGLVSREYLLVGAGASRGSDAAKTPDADYTERFDLRSQNAATAVVNHLLTRIATLTTDTCASSGWVNTAPIFLLAPLYETADPNITVTPGVVAVTATGQAPTISAGATVEPTTAARSIAGLAPSFSAHFTAEAVLAALGLSGFAPEVTTGGGLTERLTPNVVLAGGSNLRDSATNSPPTVLADIADESGSPDTIWWRAVNPEADIDIRLGFPTSSGNLIGQQTIKVLIRGTSLPCRNVRVDLYESGVPAPGSPTVYVTEAVSSITGQIVTLNFLPTDISDQTGAGVEIRIRATAA